ncbi:MAG: hypothetical protein IT581_21165 [Verrucomicrobiales bacterium]|nr:hypothetical protein [Verrucomicrobiales bacterium]
MNPKSICSLGRSLVLAALSLLLPVSRADVNISQGWKGGNNEPAGVQFYGSAARSTYMSAFLLGQSVSQSGNGAVVFAKSAQVQAFSSSFSFSMWDSRFGPLTPGNATLAFRFGAFDDGTRAFDTNAMTVTLRSHGLTGVEDHVAIVFKGKVILDSPAPMNWIQSSLNSQSDGCHGNATFQLSVDRQGNLTWRYLRWDANCQSLGSWGGTVPLGDLWSPQVQNDWRFGFEGDSPALIRMAVDDISVSATPPDPTILCASSLTLHQEVPTPFVADVTSFEPAIADGAVVVSAFADNPSLLPNENIQVNYSSGHFLIQLTGAKGASGSTTLRILARYPNAATSTIIPVAVTIEANTPPSLSALGSAVIQQGRTLTLPFTWGSSYWMVGDLRLALAEVIPSSGALVQVARHNAYPLASDVHSTNATFTILPRLDRTGTTQVKLTVTDPLGAASESLLNLTVVPETNSPTVAGTRSALSFNESANTAQYAVEIGGPVPALGSQFTLEAWVKPSALADTALNPVFTLGSISGQGTYALLGIQGNGQPSFAGNFNDAIPTTGTVVPLGVWSHLAAVINGTAVSFYLNGTPAGSAVLPRPATAAPGPLAVAWDRANDHYFQGQIDEVRIWSVARSQTDLQGAMFRLVQPTEPGLVRAYSFDEGTYDIASQVVSSISPEGGYGVVWDRSAAGSPLTLVQFPTYVNGVALDSSVGAQENTTLKVPLVASVAMGTNVLGAGVAREVFYGFSGTGLSSLTNNPGFPNNPSAISLLGDFLEVPLNALNGGGERFRGYFLPPQTGTYVFWIASCNEGALFLSSNEDPANLKPLASSPATGVGFRQWTAAPSQKSAAVNLVAGQRYYFEILHQADKRDTSGSTHLSVRWQLPDKTLEEPIPAPRVQLLGQAAPNAGIQLFLAEPPEFGTASIDSGILTYTPNRYFYGTDDLAYYAVSRGQTSAVARVRIPVANSHTRPFAGTDGALSLSGGSLDISGSVSVGTGSFTLEAWIQRAAAGRSDWVVTAGNAATNQAMVFGWDASDLFQFGWWANPLKTPVTYAQTNWNHWAASYDASTGNRDLYLNGILVASDTVTNQAQFDTAAFLHVGSYFGRAPYFTGSLKEIRLWNRARSASEILQTVSDPLTGNEDNLIAYFRLNEGNGLNAADSSAPKPSGLRYQGTLAGTFNWITSSNLVGTVVVPRNSPGQQIYLPAYNPRGNPLVFSFTRPDHGTLTGTGPVVTYRPATNYSGPDQISYVAIDPTVTDGSGTSDTAQIRILVARINLPPQLFVGFSDQEVEEEEGPIVLPFSVDDLDTALGDLVVTAESSNPVLLPAGAIVLGGNDGDRTLTLDPAEGEVGVARITLRVSDGELEVTHSFEVKVQARLAFAAMDLGELSGKPFSIATAINARGQVAGYTGTDSDGANPRGFYYGGLGEVSEFLSIGTLGGNSSVLSGLNSLGQAVGTSLTSGGQTNGFVASLAQSTTLSNVGSLIGGTFSTLTAINEDGVAVGYSHDGSGRPRAVVYDGTLNPVLPTNFTATASYALSVNSSRTIVGYAVMPDGSTNAFRLVDGQDLITYPPLAGQTGTVATSVNDAGAFAGYLVTSSGAVHAAAGLTNDAWTDLGDGFGGGDARIHGLNNFEQAVGTARGTDGQYRAFYFERGRFYDLNQLLPPDSDWHLTDATAINDQGQIVGFGERAGQTRAFLLFPASEIGRRVFRPEGALATQPEIELLQSGPGDNAHNSFFWSTVDQKLFAIRPVVAVVKWHTGYYETSTNETLFGDSVIRQVYTNEVMLSSISYNVWPKDPDLHVIGSPVEVEPKDPNFKYSFISVIHTSVDGAAVDGTTKTFTSPDVGHSVLYYLKSNGRAPNVDKQPVRFTVVKSVEWNDPTYLVTNLTAVVGQPLTSALHDDYPGRNGFLLFTNAYYDGTGENAAYLRTNRSGAIIPVNAMPDRDDFVVVWYHRNTIEVAWPETPAKYQLSWPTNPPRIVIASGLGSGPLSSTRYPNLQLFNQPDPSLPGYNPNEEHAFVSTTVSAGSTIAYALRSDLNDAGLGLPPSEPYVLLKYTDAASGQWRFLVYRVVAEEAPYAFRYSGVAGNEVQPPLPISLLPLSPKNRGVSGPYWQDYSGRFYAKSAGLSGTSTDLVMRYFYPLQPGFHFDLDGDGENDLADGESVPWLDHLPSGIQGQPVDVAYLIEWPGLPPTLAVGETLMSATHGLPDVADMASVQVLYDDLSANNGSTPLQQLARLFDPLSARVVPIPDDFEWPAAIRTELEISSGHQIFPDLPYYLRTRLFLDSKNHLLGFKGVVHAQSVGQPIQLINVMSGRERQRIQQLDGDAESSEFDDLVFQLYLLTRNPNKLDLNQDGLPDDSLLTGLETDATGTNLVFEALGSGPKALTAGLPANVLPFSFGDWLRFDGQNDLIHLDSYNSTNAPFGGVANNFTIEFWARPSAARMSTSESDHGVFLEFEQNRFAVFPPQGTFAYGTGHASAGVSVGTNGISVWQHSATYLTPVLVFDKPIQDWTHVAVVYTNAQPSLYLDGALVHVGLPSVGHLVVHPGYGFGGDLERTDFGRYAGELQDMRIWSTSLTAAQIQARRSRQLNGGEESLVGYWPMSEGDGTTVADGSARRLRGTVFHNGASSSALWVSGQPPVALVPRYQVLVENNDPKQVGLPVTLHVIEVAGGPYKGSLQAILPDNVLDQRVTLRHSGDFAGDPERLEFEWYYQPAVGGLPPAPPNPDNPLTNGWTRFPQGGFGINDITLGEANVSSLITLSDNWFFLRYRGYVVDGSTPWSDWVGDPASTTTPRPLLVEGWIKRVLGGITLFDQRSSDFENYPVDSVVSSLAGAGPRYEGDIALNPSALDSPGLIQIYQTILNRGRSLSINGTPPVDFAPADQALLLAAGKISDLYMLFGNEAFADAADPTIGLNPALSSVGSLSSSMFAFENQTGSLLEEELSLLRGRDDTSAGVGAAPVYNRLFWNFTGAEGEVAYTQTYNLTDYNDDGVVDARDASLFYPQGHGDAWGHYLSALTVYYSLLRDPNFTWAAQTEAVTLGGTSLEVGYLHERKFAAAALARTKSGAEIVERTYRWNYDGEGSGQWTGYPDSRSDRAWGVTEWGWRAGEAAYFDWITGNAILPSVDPDPSHTGIEKIDRTTVPELALLPTEAARIQSVLDAADGGLNPMGLAPNVVPFDLDPTLLIGPIVRQTHFEQIYERAQAALKSAVTTFSQASELTDALRGQADSEHSFSTAVTQQELAFRNQLIGLFGFPYAADIGPGGIYPSGYVGPDLYHWQYVDTSELTAANTPRGTNFTGLYSPFQTAADKWDFNFDAGILERIEPDKDAILPVEYPLALEGYMFTAPASWGQRQAEGQIQSNLRAVLQAEASFRQALTAYNGQIARIEQGLDHLEAKFQLHRDEAQLLGTKSGTKLALNLLISAAKGAGLYAEQFRHTSTRISGALVQGVPTSEGLAIDALAPLRGGILGATIVTESTLGAVKGFAELSELLLGLGKETAELAFEADEQDLHHTFEEREAVKELEALVRAEAGLRLGVFQASQALIQAVRTHESTVEKARQVLEQRLVFRQVTAGKIAERRYRDFAFRIFRSDALEKYDTQFELASRYVYLACKAFDYEFNSASTGASELAASVVRERNLGELRDGVPSAGRDGLASILARLKQNFDVLKPSLGLNSTRDQEAQFSLRTEWLRILPAGTNAAANANWLAALQGARLDNLWNLPEFRQYCRPFAPESAGAQPGLVFSINGTTIAAGQNFFGWPLAAQDYSYDPSEFSTRIRSVAVWFTGYDTTSLARAPRAYLVPVGADVLRTPDALDFSVRTWQVVEQKIPIPFPSEGGSGGSLSWLSNTMGLQSQFANASRHSAIQAHSDDGFDLTQFDPSTRLVGRSVANTRWLLIIPGAYLNGDPNQGLDDFIASIQDIKLYFQTYSASGN